MRPLNRWMFALCVVGVLAACSKQEPTEVKQAIAAATLTPEVKQERPNACAVVTEAEMTAILGHAVTAKVKGGSACNYTPMSGTFPHVELTINWGDADVAMSATGMLGRVEPGLTSPYAGIGDKAFTVGPSVWIKKGADLIIIELVGVKDVPATAKRIYETAARRI